MNYNNIDLNSPYERNQPVLDPYDVETLLLEISCNIRDITPEAVINQYTTVIDERANEAKTIFLANLSTIVQKAIKDRNS